MVTCHWKYEKLEKDKKALSENLDEEFFQFLEAERGEDRIVGNKDMAAEASKIASRLTTVNIKILRSMLLIGNSVL